MIHRQPLKQLCQSLKLNSTLRDLNLSWNGLNHEDIIQILEMLKQNQVSKRSVLYVEVHVQGLTQIALCGNRINDDSVIAISEGVKMSGLLMSIDLSHNDFTDVGASALLNSIELNDGKFQLLLPHNSRRSLGIIAMKLTWTRVSLEMLKSIESMMKRR